MGEIQGGIILANQAFSEAADLMVGAGELYFRRKDDPNGLHHLGNVETFNITTDVTTVEKNSSMNRRRELMASVVTAVAPSGSLTMNEYNPYNLALGLFGEEHVHLQAEQQVVKDGYTVPSIPGVIELVDADGNRYYNVKNIKVEPVNAVPSVTKWSTGAPIQGTSGATIDFDATSNYVGTKKQDIIIKITSDVIASGSVSGLAFTFQEGFAGSVQTPTMVNIGGIGAKESYKLGTTGVILEVDVTNGDFSNIKSTDIFKISCEPALNDFIENTHYEVSEQSSRAGLIKLMDTEKMAAGDTILVSFETEEATFVTVSGGSAGEIEGELLFVGDPNQGDTYIIEGWDVKIQPNGDLIGLIGDDFGSFDLTVKFLSNYKEHPDYPYYKATKVGSGTGTEVRAGTYDPRE